MTTDLEAELRREFDAATPPSSLTFYPESILRQGNWTIRRRRLIAAGSAAMAVGLVAVGATVMNRPHNTAAPQPASHKATTGIVRAQVGFLSGTFQVEFDLDPRVESNVKYSVVTPDGRRQEVGGSSTGKPGQKPDATWGSGVVEGHPVTIGLVPSSASNVTITFADGASYTYGFSELADTGYRMFAVEYTAKARPTDIASIRWTGPTGIVDGIEGNHRLTGRTLTMSKGVSVEVVLRPGEGGTTTVFGLTHLQVASTGAGVDLSVATADPSGVAVVTGRKSMARTDAKGVVLINDGPPIAAGILPPGASNIGAILTTGAPARTVVVPQRLPDGRVIFAVMAEGAHPSQASKDSIKAVTWTNADGTQGRKDVTQKQGG